MSNINLTGKSLTLKELHSIAIGESGVSVSPVLQNKIKSHRKKLESQIKNFPEIPIYGTNRLHGDLKDVAVPYEFIEEYQVKYIKTHNCGTGEPLSIPEARAIMVIRLNSFLKGHSGVSWDMCNMLIELLNKNVTPWILEEGSVGASGDLVPLAMIGAVIIGLPDGKAYYKGKLLSSPEALKQSGIKPIRLGAKEAMGLTNGSNFIASIASISVIEAEKLLNIASLSTALSLEAVRGEKRAFQELINEQSDRHIGQIAIAKQIRSLIKGSMRTTKESQEIQFSNERNKERVQDRYSFRCAPQIHGAAFEAIEKLKQTLTTEINSVTDNPVFDFEKTVTVKVNGKNTETVSFASGGNFHGQLLASPIDYVKMTLTSLSIASDKRSFSLLDSHLSYGLPGDLAFDTSKADAGYMIAQYAGAARVAENRVLSTPASVMSVSTAANQEDVVSMGSVGAVHLRKVIKNLETLLAIELLCATRGIQITQEKLPTKLRKLGAGTSVAYNTILKALGDYKGDVYVRSEIEKVRDLIKSGLLIK